MSATIELDEQNGSPGVLTHGITNSNMGSIDLPTLDPTLYPVTAGSYTFEKWQRVHVTSLGGATAVGNIKIWCSPALPGGAIHLTSLRTSGYPGSPSYTAPIQTASLYTQPMPTTIPLTANLGIADSLSGSLTSVGMSDFFVHQIQPGTPDQTGAILTLNIQHDETI